MKFGRQLRLSLAAEPVSSAAAHLDYKALKKAAGAGDGERQSGGGEGQQQRKREVLRLCPPSFSRVSRIGRQTAPLDTGAHPLLAWPRRLARRWWARGGGAAGGAAPPG